MVVGVVSNTGGTPARSLGGVAFFEAVFFGHRLVNKVCGSGPPGSPLFKGGSWARCVLALFVVKAFGLNESVALARRVAPLSGGAPGSVTSWPCHSGLWLFDESRGSGPPGFLLLVGSPGPLRLGPFFIEAFALA